MDTPVISVIIPVYNVESDLRRCLDSVINQTYRNLEIILVDDGSTDRSGAICDEYASTDSRIRVLHQENAGVSAARNAGLDMVTGDFIMWVDSDDWIEKNTCEVILAVAKAQSADVVCFGFEEISMKGKPKASAVSHPGVIEKRCLLDYFLWGIFPIRTMLWNKLFSQSLFDSIRFPEGRIYEDTATLYKVVYKANKIYAINDILYHYIRRKKSVTTGSKAEKSFYSELAYLMEQLEFIKNHYPMHVNRHMSVIFMALLKGMVVLRGSSHYDEIKRHAITFIQENHGALRPAAKYSGLIKLYSYCPPLAFLYLKLKLWYQKKQEGM